MSYIREIEIKNFGPITRANLKNLKEINIIIGPNNCGKTHILKAIELLTKLSPDTPDTSSESYRRLKRYNVEIKYRLDDGNELRLVDDEERKILYVENERNLNILSSIKDKILFCDDQRCNSASNYFSNSPEVLEKIEGNIKPIDNNFIGFEIRKYKKQSTFFRKCGQNEEDKEEYEFEYQGSGIKFAVGILASLMEHEDKEILLIDEPELGLHPAAKIYLFEYLKELAKNGKQIFIVTHDPFFANPRLLDEDICSVYVYSYYEDKFVPVGLSELKHGYSFAGFFPHNLSMKDVHLYVEGASDVYAFQGFLLAYLKKKGLSMLDFNRVGIFHLGGNNYVHFLCTIPKIPKSIVVFDGNKKEETKLEKVTDRLNELRESLGEDVTFPEFVLCKKDELDERIEEAKNALDQGKCPVYFLEKDDVSEYFEFSKKPSPSDVAKEVLQVEDIPREFEMLFNLIFKAGKPLREPLQEPLQENLLENWSEGWLDVVGGTVEVTEFDGRTCLKKAVNADPAGAYKLLSRKIKRSDGKIVFKGKVYSPRRRKAYGDRLILEDALGNGYCAFVYHDNYVAIELRKKGRAYGLIVQESYKDLWDKWYDFELTIDGSKITLIISVNGVKMFELSAEDDTYNEFERVAIRGGYDYYVSDLNVHVIPPPTNQKQNSKHKNNKPTKLKPLI